MGQRLVKLITPEIGIGTKNVVIGHGSACSNHNGMTVLGYRCNASYGDSIAIGIEAISKGYAVSIGLYTKASNNAIAIGREASAYVDCISIGNHAFAGGSTPSTYARNSIVIGSRASVTGTGTIAIGHSASANDSGIAIGWNAKAERNSISIGPYARSDMYDMVTFGFGEGQVASVDGSKWRLFMHKLSVGKVPYAS